MKLQILENLLDKMPVIVTGNLIGLGLIDNLHIFDTADSYLDQLESMVSPVPRYHRVVILKESNRANGRFPRVNLNYEINPMELSEALFNNLSGFRKLMLTQSAIWERIKEHVEKDVIILVIVDGLSYLDCFNEYKVSPCLVESVSKTKEGFLTIAGNPTIGQRLFNCGFFDLRGYSFWNRHEDRNITDHVFRSFPLENMRKVNDFEQILDDLRTVPLYKTFVQIVTSGLDHLSHHSYDQPIIKPYIERIFERLGTLEQIVRKAGRSAVVIMTADHGILWRKDHKFEVKEDYILKEKSGHRYTNGRILRDYLLNVKHDNYSLLKYPFITKNLGTNQWGVHGGVSAWESIVPFYEKEVI